jgi:hypothetical protein
MTVAIRSYTSADLSGVARLRALLYHHPDDDQLDWYASVWNWLEGHPAGELHRWVLADGDTIIGFLAAVPQVYRIGGRQVVAYTPTDYMVHPNHGFHAIQLMRTFFQTCRDCVTCDSSVPAIKLQTWLGAEPAATLRHTARLFDVSVLPRSLPGPLRHLLNGGMRVTDEILTFCPRRGFKVDVFDSFDERFDRFFEMTADVLPCLPVKDAAFLRWRYGPGSPHADTCILGISDKHGLLGYASHRVTVPRRDGYVLDLSVLPGRQDVARELLRQAVCHFRRAGVSLIRYRFLESPTSPQARDIWRLGFFPRKRRHQLLVKFADPALQELARNPDNWAYNAGDGEMGFWVR